MNKSIFSKHSIFLSLAVLALTAISACVPERDIHDQLIVAARKGQVEKVKELIKLGADVNAKEKVVGEGRPALFHAASYGRTEVVKLLLQHGADVNEQPAGRTTSLMIAAWGGYTDTVKILLEAGANVNAKSADGNTALTEAIRKVQINVARLLVEYGADVNARLSDGNTPLSWAKAIKNEELVMLLKRAGARE